MAQRCLLLDVAAVEVIRELGRRGVRAILLKGSTVARWLYDREEQRPYHDVDLLVDPERQAEAGSALAALGFELLHDNLAHSWDREVHANHWLREADRVNVDLHWRVAGSAADPRLAWAQLSSTAECVRVAGTDVEALGTTARTLHLALHAAQHGGKVAQPIMDLSRGVERLPEEQWREAVTLADELDARDSLAVGLRLVPEGRLLAERLGLPNEISTHSALIADGHPYGSKRLYEIIAAPGVRQKTRRLGEALVPPASEVRKSYPSARSSTRALARAYVVRVAQGVRHLPSAVRAVARARERSRASLRTPGHEHRDYAHDPGTGEGSDLGRAAPRTRSSH